MPRTLKSKPIHTTIHDDLRKKIFAGEYTPGNLLPSESQLCAQYEVSRETVRKSLKALENEGFIFSRPKIGYFVSKPNYSSFQLSYSRQFEDCATEYRKITAVPPDEDVRSSLELEGKDLVIEFQQIALGEGNVPIGVNLKYVPYERAYPSVEAELRYAVLPDPTLSRLSTFALYTKIEVCAVAAPPEVANFLECAVSDPLLLIRKLFISQSGRKVAYEKQYLRQPFGMLQGTAGHQE